MEFLLQLNQKYTQLVSFRCTNKGEARQVSLIRAVRFHLQIGTSCKRRILRSSEARLTLSEIISQPSVCSERLCRSSLELQLSQINAPNLPAMATNRLSSEAEEGAFQARVVQSGGRGGAPLWAWVRGTAGRPLGEAGGPGNPTLLRGLQQKQLFEYIFTRDKATLSFLLILSRSTSFTLQSGLLPPPCLSSEVEEFVGGHNLRARCCSVVRG